jgi:hypothetical protein
LHARHADLASHSGFNWDYVRDAAALRIIAMPCFRVVR